MEEWFDHIIYYMKKDPNGHPLTWINRYGSEQRNITQIPNIGLILDELIRLKVLTKRVNNFYVMPYDVRVEINGMPSEYHGKPYQYFSDKAAGVIIPHPRKGYIKAVREKLDSDDLPSLDDNKVSEPVPDPIQDSLSELVNSHLNNETKRNAIICEPNYRNILYLISNNNQLFTGDHYIEVLRIFSSDKVKYEQLGESIRMVIELRAKRYIEIKKFNHIVTFKGQLYRLYTHPSLTFWGIVLGIVAAFLIYFLQR